MIAHATAAIAVWITERDNLHAVQSVGGWIGAGASKRVD